MRVLTVTGVPIGVDFGKWRDIIADAHGPAEHTTRLLLLVLSLYMNPKLHADWCYPSQLHIARRTGMSERAVRKHLKLAQTDGWLSVQYRPPSVGKQPVRGYASTIPAKLGHLLEQPANGAGGTFRDRHSVPVGPARGAGGTGILCQNDRHGVPPNSYSELKVNTQSESGGRKRGSESPCESEEDRKHSRARLQSIREGLELRGLQGAAEESA